MDLIDKIEGEPRDKKSPQVETNSLKNIDWQAATFKTAGGKLVQQGDDWIVILPAKYSTGENTYEIKGTAINIKGYHSSQTNTKVTVH